MGEQSSNDSSSSAGSGAAQTGPDFEALRRACNERLSSNSSHPPGEAVQQQQSEPFNARNSIINRNLLLFSISPPSPSPAAAGAYCAGTFDGWLCWPDTAAGTSAYELCPDFITGFEPTSKFWSPIFASLLNSSSRVSLLLGHGLQLTGLWELGTHTVYHIIHTYINKPKQRRITPETEMVCELLLIQGAGRPNEGSCWCWAGSLTPQGHTHSHTCTHTHTPSHTHTHTPSNTHTHTAPCMHKQTANQVGYLIGCRAAPCAAAAAAVGFMFAPSSLALSPPASQPACYEYLSLSCFFFAFFLSFFVSFIKKKRWQPAHRSIGSMFYSTLI